MDTPISWWIAFNVFVLAMLALDLGVFHRKSHEVRFREAFLWSIVWISLAMAFNGWIWHALGAELGLQFLTGYVVEKSLSVDNIFVFLMVFGYFQVPGKYQHKVLFWGIIGALVMRAFFIFAGVALINKFHFMIYVFGGFLVLTGIRMAFMQDKKLEPEKNPVLKAFRRIFPVTNDFVEGKFFVRQNGRLMATPLMLTLVFIEVTDLIFAVDSIPAILAISRDPFIVYTSNVFAILGLRSLYFCLAGFMNMFRYLSLGLSAVLIFIGIKMLLADIYKIPVPISLSMIFLLLAAAIIASLYAERRDRDRGIIRPPKE